ncbi:hypothetical protein AB0H07_42800 [Streptomyces sp. NPDC021354]|uniref:hypothetical protein n=1 Tax=Streptomyces sp. NPDC021354 TaxID=3154793 RepID=UPI00340393E9
MAGFVKYASSNCAESWLNQHTAALRFNVPIEGANTYTPDCSGAFDSVHWGGSGTHPVLMWDLSKP